MSSHPVAVAGRAEPGASPDTARVDGASVVWGVWRDALVPVWERLHGACVCGAVSPPWEVWGLVRPAAGERPVRRLRAYRCRACGVTCVYDSGRGEEWVRVEVSPSLFDT